MNEKPSVRLHREGSFIEIRWPSAVSHEDYKRSFEEALGVAQSEGVRKLLLNQTGTEKVEPRSRNWMLSTFVPTVTRLIGSDLTLAIVMPRQRLVQTLSRSMAGLAASIVPGLEMRFFETAEEARQWIASPGS